MTFNDAEKLADQLAQLFHEHYERLAPEHGYETKEETRKPWDEVPAQNRALMRRTVMAVITNMNPVQFNSLKEFLLGAVR